MNHCPHIEFKYHKINKSFVAYIRKIRNQCGLETTDECLRDYREWYTNVWNWYSNVRSIGGINGHLRRTFRYLSECAAYPECHSNGKGVGHEKIALVSKQAFAEIKKYGKKSWDSASKNLVREHPIPMKVLEFILTRYLDIKENKGRSKACWRDFIKEFFRYSVLLVLVTDSENNELTSKGLRTKLPVDFDGDLLSRYEEAKIKIFVKRLGIPFERRYLLRDKCTLKEYLKLQVCA